MIDASPKKVLSDTGTLSLRRVVQQDCEQLLRWRNDPWIASLSTKQRTVCEEDHARWFKALLRDPDKLAFVVRMDDLDIGALRIDRIDVTRAEITVYLLRPFTGFGLGTNCIRQGSRATFATWPDLLTIHALIRRDNPASAAAFRNAGFADCPVGKRIDCRAQLVELQLERS